MKKQNIIAIILFFYLVVNFAHANIPGQLNKEIVSSKKPARTSRYKKQTPAPKTEFQTLGTLDTLRWCDDNTDVNFGGWSGDYFAEYFVPATDGNIRSITFNMSDLPDEPGGKLTVWVYKANYSWPEINTKEIAGTEYDSLGYYSTPDGESPIGTDWKYGTINDWPGADSTKKYDPLGEKLWPLTDSMTIELEPNASDNAMITVNFDNFYWSSCDTLFVLVKVDGFPRSGFDTWDENELRFGFAAQAIDYEPMPFIKFYNKMYQYGTRPTDVFYVGWQIQEYALDWRLAVDYTGSPAPRFYDVTELKTTLSTESREVCASATNSGYHCGVPVTIDSILLYYSTDGKDFQYSIMELCEGTEENYKGLIPGFEPGTEITYYVGARLSDGYNIASLVYKYSLYSPTEDENLLIVMNDEQVDYSEDLCNYTLIDRYLYPPAWDTDTYDIWDAANWGPVSKELLDHYEAVIDLSSSNPACAGADQGGTDIYNWLSEATITNRRCYALFSQDYGEISNYADTTFPDGSLEKDFLGIQTLGPQDVNWDGTQTSLTSPYRIDPVSAGFLTRSYISICTDSIALYYNPYDELGYYNWIDNLTPIEGASVLFTDPNHNNAPVGIYYEGYDFLTVFCAFDPLSLCFHDSTDASGFYSNSIDCGCNITSNLLGQFFMEGNIDDPVSIPYKFYLDYNYPNPFNPITTIEYEIPNRSNIELSIYDIHGRLVENLVNKTQSAGKYSVEWNASNHSSGVYFYKIKADGFQQTRKMVLVK